MNFSIKSIDCFQFDNHTKRKAPFRVACYTFDYISNPTDKVLIDKIIVKGEELARLVNPCAANDSETKRSIDKIINNCIAGILSEYLWGKFLNRENPLVSRTVMSEASTQIDLKIISNDKKIEVRSSFPHNGINFAICSSTDEFDILGPYSNSYKPGEIQKDYYVRALFHMPFLRYWKNPQGQSVKIYAKITERIKKDGFEAYLTGGATWSMMINDKIAKNKSFIPEDELSLSRLKTASVFRVVPFHDALDTIEIYNLVKAEK
jgi:hypothetical protein